MKTDAVSESELALLGSVVREYLLGVNPYGGILDVIVEMHSWGTHIEAEDASQPAFM